MRKCDANYSITCSVIANDAGVSRLRARRQAHTRRQCAANMFEDLLRNAKVYSTFRKKIVFQFSYSSGDSVPEILLDEDEEELQQD